MKTTKLKFSTILAAFGYTLLVAGLSSCTDESGARKALERNNYQPIKVGGYDWLGGSKGDFYITKFEAIAPNGDTVYGCVTKGFWKGSTIRLDD